MDVIGVALAQSLPATLVGSVGCALMGPGSTYYGAGYMADNGSRYDSSIAALQDGRILYAAGANASSNPSNSSTYCAIYDPSADSWTQSANRPWASHSNAMTTLPDGKVFLTGGYYGNTTVYASTALYNPATNVWTSKADMPATLGRHAQSLLLDGRVIVTGGMTAVGFNPSSATYIWDPVTNVWSTVAAIPAVHYNHGQSTLLDGRVLIAGGTSNGGSSYTARLYNPTTNLWATTGDTLYSHNGGGGGGGGQVTLQDGRAMLFGGTSNKYIHFPDMYDPATGAWADGPMVINDSGGSTPVCITPAGVPYVLLSGLVAYDLAGEVPGQLIKFYPGTPNRQRSSLIGWLSRKSGV